MKKLKVRKTKAFWLYFVLGGLFVAAAVIFAPFWLSVAPSLPWAPWSNYALGIIVGVLILLYIFLVLLKRVKQKGLAKVTRFAMGFEFGLMIVFAIFAILKGVFYEEPKLKFLNTCEILAIILWVRGVVEVINAYYHDHKSDVDYPLWYLFVNILLISVSPLLFMFALKTSNIDTIVSYAISGVLLLIGAYVIVYGVLCKPEKVKKEKPVEVKEETQEEVLAEIQEVTEPVQESTDEEDDGLVEQVSPVELVLNETENEESTEQ